MTIMVWFSVEYSVIIPTHNEGHHLVDTVRSILDGTDCCDRHHEQTEIIVANDLSTDDSIERLKDELRDRAGKRLRIVSNRERGGTCRTRRNGCDFAFGNWLFNTDAHAEVSPLWLHDFEDAVFEVAPEERVRRLYSGFVHVLGNYNSFSRGFLMSDPAPNSTPFVEGPVLSEATPYPAMSAIAGCHFITRQFYNEIGGYLPIYMPPWGVDEEIGLRVWALGGECHIIPTLHMSVLFRPEFPYDVSMTSVTFNNMLTAQLHLDAKRFGTVMNARLEQGAPVGEALDELMLSDVGEWKTWLQHNRTRTINEIFDMFAIGW